jgi:polar amino acid transport system substrate-binding protein
MHRLPVSRLPPLLLLLLSLLSLSALAGPAAAMPLRLCIFDRPLPPITMPDGSGQVQELLRRAARTASISIHAIPASRPQCLAQLQSGEVDAMLGAFLPERLAYAAYPMAGDQPDESQAVAQARFMVYRRHGSAVDWDGRHFSNLGRQPVGIQPAFLHAVLLHQMGVVTDEDSRSTADNLAKLVQNRVAAVVALEGEAGAVISAQLSGQVEVLPQPFHVTPMYLVVNRDYYRQHQALVDGYWLSLRQYRLSVDYQQFLQRPR